MLFKAVEHMFKDAEHKFKGVEHKFTVREHKNQFEGETFVVQKEIFCRTDLGKKFVRNKKLVE